MASKRKAISKKVRFEVFKRDSFICQYCGRKAPDVVLQVDHIKPVSKGGPGNILNLITSCQECNCGKSNRPLDDQSVIEKQRKQLENLQERREQLDMLFEWQKGLLNIEANTVAELSGLWSKMVPGYQINKNGESGLRKLLTKFSIGEIIDAMTITTSQYLKYKDGNETPTHESVELAWKKIGGICVCRRRDKDNPNLSRIYYVRGILRKRGLYVNEKNIITMLRDAVLVGVDIEKIVGLAKAVGNWSEFRDDVQSLTESAMNDKEM
jgi:hypothetical protein